MTHQQKLIAIVSKSLRTAEACIRVLNEAAKIYGVENVSAEHMYYTAKANRLRHKLNEIKGV